MSDKSESDDKNKRQEPVNPDLGDWSPDYFPVSAKPIFRRSFLLVCGVGLLCGWVAYCSEHNEDDKKTGPNPEVQQSWSSQNPDDPNAISENQEDIPDNDKDVF